jgi:hypothetical protein
MKIYFYNALHTWLYINILLCNASLTSVIIKIEIKLKFKITYVAWLTL